MRAPEALYLVHTSLGSNVPQPYHAVAAHAAKLGIFDGVEGYFLDRSQVTLKLG